MRGYLKNIFLSIFVLIPTMAWCANSTLTNIRVIDTNTSTRIIFSLTQPAEQKLFTLSNPTRLVMDFNHTRLAERLKNLKFPTQQVKSIRSGYPKLNTLRLVMEINPATHFQIMPVGKSQRFILDIYSGNQKTMPQPSPPLKPVLVAQPKQTVTVVIDAGHGGKDPGAVGVRGTQEKEVVLGIAKRLAALIDKEPNMRAVLTRKGDYFVPLINRLKLARKGKADLFISIHADSYFNTQASGASVYALSRRGATSVAAKWLAKRENYSELGGVELSELEDQSVLLRSVLIDLAQTATITDSLRLGNSMLNALDNMVNLHYKRVEQAPFMVLKSPDIPSILVETGFISNVKEELHLRDERYQAQMAQAIFNGVRVYVKKYANPG